MPPGSQPESRSLEKPGLTERGRAADAQHQAALIGRDRLELTGPEAVTCFDVARSMREVLR
jgi:hypothetical protein